MTYCVGIMVDDGLVFASDSRTNAGVDHISTFRKLFTYVKEGDRVIVIMSSGNLSVTQSVESLLRRAVQDEVPGRSLMLAPTMFDAARTVGATLREVDQYDGPSIRAVGADASSSLILGGQIAGERPRLFLIYGAGNFIEATPETPYVQIGETKYGKPVIDRLIRPETDLMVAAKCALVSFDSTIRSNLSVGLPIDMAVYRRDSLRLRRFLHIEQGDAYFAKMHEVWSTGISRLFSEIPDPNWNLDEQQPNA